MAIRKSDRRSTARRVEYLLIECVSPELDGGRYPIKRIVGDSVVVGADILKEGHDQVAARVVFTGPGDEDWCSAPMAYDVEGDRWYGTFPVDRIGQWTFSVEAWTDRFATWRSALKKKVDVGQDVANDLLDGGLFARAAARSARSKAARASLLMTAKVLEDRRDIAIEQAIQRALDDDFLALMRENLRPTDLT
ncbi:MAG TPA: maltotransferase domain-containing protein, partial [Gemmatimonadaceae bacterium]